MLTQTFLNTNYSIICVVATDSQARTHIIERVAIKI